jgi:3-deoxy-D-manno-octulosonic-acid transferase
MNILTVFYDCLFFLGLLAWFPFALWRKKVTPKVFGYKMGFALEPLSRGAIWIHAVSVGEIYVIGNLLKRLRELTEHPLVVSTTTLTGNALAKERYSSLAEVIFFPFDISFVLQKFLRTIEPRVFIAVETEIWPNLFFRLRKRSIPILILNGRISQRAYIRYKRFRWLFSRILNKCRHISVQNDTYRDRFVSLGISPEKIVVGGNMKFESISLDPERLSQIQKKYAFLKKGSDFLLVAGSTHAPEEEIILEVFKALVQGRNDTRLLIAPRHPQRVTTIEKIARSHNFNPVRLSRPQSSSGPNSRVFISDTIGELLYLYNLADICFVGGSFSNTGGHNILEPVYCSKPTIFGPCMSNFADAKEVVLEKEAGIQVDSQTALQNTLSQLMADSGLRDKLKARCQEVFGDQRKSLEKNIQLILDCLKV